MEQLKIKIELPDHAYYEDEVECRAACPVRTDARGYLLATVDEEFEEAYRISRATNPFASICGKVCGAPCETGCRRSDTDEPLVIRNIKGFLTERHGPEAGDLKTPLTHSIAPGSVDPEPNGRSVGVIGGGCAGYTCAHDLARLGYAVTIYEKYNASGGMLVQGVPVNRLSRQVVQAEIDSILQLPHIRIEHNVDVGTDISFADIKAKHDAVFIGVGLSVGKMIPLKNADHEDVHAGLGFLLDFNMREKWDLRGKRSIVIGGGDVAFDVARSALRCGSPDVQLCCLEREALDEMTGSVDEREGGRREGVIINDGWGPDEVVVEDGKIKGLRIKKVKRVFDEEGRFAPELEDESRLVEGETVFMAVGQGSDLNFLEGSGVETTPQGWITVDPDTMATNVAGVFAGGDISHGPKLFIDAIAAGTRAAQGIDSYFSKQPVKTLKRKMTFKDFDEYDRGSEYVDHERAERDELPVDPAAQPELNTTVEYDLETAKLQSDRCLACHIHPTFEGDICILCGGCVDVCPSYCLSMKRVDRVECDEPIKQLMEMEFGSMAVAEREGSVMLFDPLKCIRCGMCAQKCPTGSCKMTENSFCDCFE